MASYTKTVWQDLPNQTTPVSASNLNKLENAMEAIYNMIYPVGSIYMSVNSANPSTLFGGTWVAWGSGKVPVGVDSNDSLFDTVEKTGGSKTKTLNQNNLPVGTEVLELRTNGQYSNGMWKPNTEDSYSSTPLENIAGHSSSDYGQPFSIMQPYITCYMWKRVS